MLEAPYPDSSTTAQKQRTTPPAADIQAQLAAAMQEVANLRQVVSDQQKVIAGQKARLDEAETFRQNVLKERTYLRRGDIDPTTKLTAVIAAWELGITFGNDNKERPQQHKKITAEKVADQVGVSKSVAMGRLNALTTPAEGFTPYFQKETVWRKQQDTGAPFSFNQLAGPEGGNWMKTWGADPLQMPVPPPPPRQQKNAEHQRAKAAEQRAVVAEARRILAQCPHCGSQDVSLLCHHCGAKTPATEALPAPSTPESADSALSQSNTCFGEEDAGTPKETAVSPKRKTSSESADSALHSNEDDKTYKVCIDIESAESAVPDGATAGQGDNADESEIARMARLVKPLVDAGDGREVVLAQAVYALLRALGEFPNHVVMQRRKMEEGNKYLTVSSPIDALLTAQHLVGTVTLGTGLLTVQEDQGGQRRCRAVAYDSDATFGTLVAASRRLAARGITSLLVRNDAKHASGHLWVFVDADVDPAQVFAALETWAPMLAAVKERFPAPSVRGGHRLRLPGGCYLPVGLDPVPVQVALATEKGDIEWVDALSPEAWLLIATATTPAEALQHAWIPPENRPRPDEPAPAKKQAAAPAGKPSADTTVEDAVARFNAEHAIASLVDVRRSGQFRSPWHSDATPSCKLYDGDRWTDFSRENRGGDALALWCALNGFWDEGVEKPERIKALRHLGYLAPEKRGFSVRLRDDTLLVSLRHADKDKWEAARQAFKKAFPAARYEPDDKAWGLPASQRDAVTQWAKAFAAAQRSGAS